MPGPIEAVIFDYGGVISSPLFRGVGRFEADMGYPPGAVLELLFGEAAYIGVEGRAHASTRDVERASAASHAVTHDWHRLEVGEIGLDEYLAGVVERAPAVLGAPLDTGAYFTFLSRMPIGVHWAVVHRARELRDRGLRLGLLTNNVREWGERWRTTFPVDELFEVVVDSSDAGMRKPDPRVYRLTCERLGVAPDVVAFVDDNHENVAAARALGMETVHFGEDPFEALAELDRILERRGVRRTR